VIFRTKERGFPARDALVVSYYDIAEMLTNELWETARGNKAGSSLEPGTWLGSVDL
jgi:hypothetical protein